MPATATHAFFAKDVYDILPDNIQSLIDVKRSMMFAQSTDSLTFYNLFSILPGKSIRKYQSIFHSRQSQEFFMNLLRYIRDNDIVDTDVYSFLMGFICHFSLDSTVHPYVIYKCGMFNKKDANTYKYNNIHAFMEAFLDNDMISRRLKINPYKFNYGKFCFDTRKFSDNLNKTIDYAFYNTFHWQNMSSIYYKSLKQMKFSINTFRRDPYGIKKFFYKLADTFTPRSCFRYEAISYHVPLEDKFNYLNNNHTLWRNPTSYNMTSTLSFVDLYLKAIKQAKVLVCASFDYLNGKDIDLEQVFPDISYVTGLDWKKNKELKYFEF